MGNIREEIYTGIPANTTIEEELETFEQLCNELSESLAELQKLIGEPTGE
jgi:hypothetical protein